MTFAMTLRTRNALVVPLSDSSVRIATRVVCLICFAPGEQTTSTVSVSPVILDENTVIIGKDFSVTLVPGFANWHSHPVQAYKVYKCFDGWPSADDYMVFLEASIFNVSRFHCVATVEGLYVISLSSEMSKWASRTTSRAKLPRMEIFDKSETMFHVPHTTAHITKDKQHKRYRKYIRNLTYNDGKTAVPIFNLRYIYWRNQELLPIESRTMRIFFPRSYGQCSVTFPGMNAELVREDIAAQFRSSSENGST
jgi:hypothetical protein